MSLLITLFIEFFKTGLFAVGGGLATIPFLYEMIDKYHWFTPEMLSTMIAVSESTPGAIGVNMATYVGYITTNSLLGGVITTIGLVCPSVIVICIIAQFLKTFKDSKYVQNIFYGLRPAVTAMIASAGIGIFVVTMFNNSNLTLSNFINHIQYIHLFIFFIVLFISNKFKKLHPIVLITGCAILGIILSL